MPSSAVRTFTDPYEHQKSVRAAEAELFITKPGEYRAELTRIDLHRLWMQDSHTALPHVARHALKKDRSVIFFLADPQQIPIHHSGLEFSPGEIMVEAIGSDHYHRVPAKSHWSSMSLTPDDLAAAGEFVAGIELTAPLANRKIRPPPVLMARLAQLHQAAIQLAATVPDILAHTEVAKAIEHELVRVMIACLTEGVTSGTSGLSPQRLPVMRRFEQVLEENRDRPLYLTEICAAIGVADRTLRLHCLEHLGMSPHRYLLAPPHESRATCAHSS